jgi:hypothetical protein
MRNYRVPGQRDALHVVVCLDRIDRKGKILARHLGDEDSVDTRKNLSAGATFCKGEAIVTRKSNATTHAACTSPSRTRAISAFSAFWNSDAAVKRESTPPRYRLIRPATWSDMGFVVCVRKLIF